MQVANSTFAEIAAGQEITMTLVRLDSLRDVAALQTG